VISVPLVALIDPDVAAGVVVPLIWACILGLAVGGVYRLFLMVGGK